MITKNDTQWPVFCQLEKQIKQVGRWESESWDWQGIELLSEVDLLSKTELLNDTTNSYTQLLELHKDERTDYRFNLSSNNPKLFLALEFLDTNSDPKIAHLTASQASAACYMDTDYLVLSIDMPLAIQAWIEAFIGRHGELIENKKKKRKGAGRSNGN